MNIVVVGCGAMGLPMALHLRQAGNAVAGYDVRPNNEFAAMQSSMLADLSGLDETTVMIVVVRDYQQILDVCFEHQAVFSQPDYPRILVISSTVSPRSIADLRQRLPADVALVDAPMSGAPYSAHEGSLTFMVGGPPDVVEQLLPLFEAMGEKIQIMGDVGQGMLTKVMNNYVAACSVVAVRRSLSRAAENGLSAHKLLEVMRSSSGATWFGDNLDKINWAAENYSPDNTIGILEKDVNCSLDAVTHNDEFDQQLLSALRELPRFPDDVS